MEVLNFSSLSDSYPFLHLCTPVSKDRTFVYTYTHTAAPEVGQQLKTMCKRRDATVISVDKVEPPKSPHHPVPVMLYTITCKIDGNDLNEPSSN